MTIEDYASSVRNLGARAFLAHCDTGSQVMHSYMICFMYLEVFIKRITHVDVVALSIIIYSAL